MVAQGSQGVATQHIYRILLLQALLPACPLRRQPPLDGVHPRCTAKADGRAPFRPSQAQGLPWLPRKKCQLPHQRKAGPAGRRSCRIMGTTWRQGRSVGMLVDLHPTQAMYPEPS